MDFSTGMSFHRIKFTFSMKNKDSTVKTVSLFHALRYGASDAGWAQWFFGGRMGCNILKNLQHVPCTYTLSEAWSGVNWADLIAAQGAFGTVDAMHSRMAITFRFLLSFVIAKSKSMKTQHYFSRKIRFDKLG